MRPKDLKRDALGSALGLYHFVAVSTYEPQPDRKVLVGLKFDSLGEFLGVGFELPYGSRVWLDFELNYPDFSEGDVDEVSVSEHALSHFRKLSVMEFADPGVPPPRCIFWQPLHPKGSE